MASDTSATDSSQNYEGKDSVIETAVNICTQQVGKWNRKRAPPGLGKKLAITRATEHTSTARIFLDHGGFVAWLAYSLATDGKTHFRGRLVRHNAMRAFQALPFGDRLRAAKRVAGFAISDAARERILAISKQLENRGISTNYLGNNEVARSKHVSSPVSTTYTNDIPPMVTHSTPYTIPETFPTTPDLTARRNQTVINASLEGVGNIFGEYMCRAIRRVPVQNDAMPIFKAAVTMEFPDFVLVDCVMMLEVREEEVERLVKDLFAIQVESVMGIRHLLLGKGVRLTSNTSNPEITLKGVRDEAILHVFGPEIYGAIRASKMYRTELQEKKVSVTECVSMIFTSKSGEGAYINLCLDLKGGLEIRDKLCN